MTDAQYTEEQFNNDFVRLPEVRQVLRGLGILLGKHEGDLSHHMRRADHATVFAARPNTVLNVLDLFARRASKGRRYVRAASPKAFAGDAEPDNTVMRVVVRDHVEDGPEGPTPMTEMVTAARRGDQLYYLVVPEGNMRGVEAIKAGAAQAVKPESQQ